MRSEKQFLLDDAESRVSTSGITVAFSYKGMNANTTSDFRDAIVSAGGSIYVMKKTMLVKAAKQAGLNLDLKELPGHIALMYSDEDNAVASTKALYTFKKESGGLLEVLGGKFEGQPCKADDFEKISKLPTQDEMRAQMLSVFEAPMAQTLSVVEALLTSVMHCLENKAKEN